MSDTICALATAPGRAAVAVVRVSGPDTRGILETVAGGRLTPRRATLRALVGAEGDLIDRALVLWFPAPGSYTGEDSAELQVHGGPAVTEAVIDRLLDLGVRLAEPGEFTRRAFENGKLDLGQAEAVADLVDAESVAQARQAIAQLDGALGERYMVWRSRMLRVLGLLEAAVDFPDEEVPEAVEEQAARPLCELIEDLTAALDDGVRGRRVREGYRVAVMGAPNAGKSSLLNLLVDRDAAIVTPVAGATRDVIEAPLLLSGYRVVVADMAGLRDTTEVVEQEGVRRARAWAESADVRLWVIDRAGRGDDWRKAAALARPGDLAVLNKSDLALTRAGSDAADAAEALGLSVVPTSFVSEGDGPVRQWLEARVVDDLTGSDFPATTRARHAARLAEARDHLRRAVETIQRPELAAEDVRLAVRALAMVTGAIGVEDVLGEVFSTFCIGK